MLQSNTKSLFLCRNVVTTFKRFTGCHFWQ